MRDVEIAWEDLLEAFANSDTSVLYFLDRDSGEIFAVPDDYENEGFWEEVDFNADRYLRIPTVDADKERALVQQFVKDTADPALKSVLEKGMFGRVPYDQMDEILSFYPEERERLTALREEMATERIKRWLEEKDIYFSEEPV